MCSSPQLRRALRARCSGSWFGSDNLAGPDENFVQHGLRQLARGRVLLARMIGREQGGGHIVVICPVSESEIRQTCDRAPPFQDAEVGIESQLPQSDHYAHVA